MRIQTRATLAQLVERLTFNQMVGGSIPPSGFFHFLQGSFTKAYAGVDLKFLLERGFQRRANHLFRRRSEKSVFGQKNALLAKRVLRRHGAKGPVLFPVLNLAFWHDRAH